MAALTGVDQFRAGLAVIEGEVRAAVHARRAGAQVTIEWSRDGRRFDAADAPLVDAISLEAVCAGRTGNATLSREQVDDSAHGWSPASVRAAIRHVVAALTA